MWSNILTFGSEGLSTPKTAIAVLAFSIFAEHAKDQEQN